PFTGKQTLSCAKVLACLEYAQWRAYEPPVRRASDDRSAGKNQYRFEGSNTHGRAVPTDPRIRRFHAAAIELPGFFDTHDRGVHGLVLQLRAHVRLRDRRDVHTRGGIAQPGLGVGAGPVCHHVPHHLAVRAAVPGQAGSAGYEDLRRAGRGGDQVNVGNPAVNIAIFAVFVVATLVIVFRVSGKTKTTTGFFAGGRVFTGGQNGMAISADYLSAASFLGIVGAVAL